MRHAAWSRAASLAAALLACAPAAHALDPQKALTQYGRDVWQLESGLPQNSVYALAQTADGYLWFGTAEGLVRFDGVRFTVYDRRHTPAFASNVVGALSPSRAGGLWIGTDSGVLRLREGSFTPVPALAARITALKEDARGTLWIGTGESGVLRLDAGAPSPVTVPGLGNPHVRALAEGTDGTIWVASEGGGVDGLREGRVARRLRARDGLASDRVQSLTLGRQGDLWIGTYDGSLHVLDARGLRSVPPPVRSSNLSSLMVDGQGTLWVGTAGGLSRWRSGAWESMGPTEGLSEHVLSLAEDVEGNLWVGTLGGGLYRLRDGRFIAFGVAEGLRRDSIRALAEDRAATVWIGSEGGGISALRGGTIVRTLTGREGLISDRVYSIAEAASGALWIGTAGGLSRLQDGRLASYAPPAGMMGTGVHVVMPSRDGALWIGTFRSGLYRLEPEAVNGRQVTGRLTRFTTRDGLASDSILSLAEARDGGLWVGTAGGGLSRMKDGRLTSLTARDGLPSGFVYSLHEDAAGSLWVGTFGGGLCRLKAGRLSVIGTGQGLADDVVYGLVEDEAGDFWLTSNRGIFRVSRAELDAVADGRLARVTTWSYDLHDGLRSVECNSGGNPALRARDGALWFATVKGALRTDRSKLAASTWHPPVHVEQVLVDGEVLAGPEPRLEPGRERFEFHYTALGLRAPSHIRFRYRLEGLDGDWVEAGTRRVAYYNRLSHGGYVFRVMASNEDGVWSISPAAFAFSIAPHFYETLWFKALAVLMAGLAVVAVHRARVRHVTTRAALLEALVTERTAELKQSEGRAQAAREEAERASQAKSAFLARMSHELRTPLNIILGFVQLLDQEPSRPASERERLGLIGRSGEHLLRLINDVLSLAKIESGRLTLEDTVFDPRRPLRDVEDMFRTAAAAKGLTLSVSMAPGWPAAVRGDEGKLRQVLINLLGNAVKFTSEGGVALSAQWQDGRAVLEVDDSGPGVAPEERRQLFESFAQTQTGRQAGEGTGLGLSISRSFVRLMGGDIEALPAPGGGARFCVTIPLPEACEPLRAPPLPAFRFVLAPGQAPRRLLIADDNEMNRLLLRQILETMGFPVREATSGGEAVALWEQWQPDLVWMDVYMDGMDGNAATQEIRRREAASGRPRTKIVALTASATDADREASMMAGADDVVAKPFRIATIASVLARHVDVRLIPTGDAALRAGVGAGGVPVASGESAPPPPSLAHLPEPLTADLRKAIRLGDVQLAYSVVERIREHDQAAAESLRAMIRAYRFEEILALTSGAL